MTTSTPLHHRHLTPVVISELRSRLEEERSRLLERYGRHQERQRAIRMDEAEDFADHAQEGREREELLSLEEEERRRLLLVEEALDRLGTGTYGLCQYSGQPIPVARLRAVPWTRYRAEVQEGIEQGHIDERLSQGWPTSR